MYGSTHTSTFTSILTWSYLTLLLLLSLAAIIAWTVQQNFHVLFLRERGRLRLKGEEAGVPGLNSQKKQLHTKWKRIPRLHFAENSFLQTGFAKINDKQNLNFPVFEYTRTYEYIVRTCTILYPVVRTIRVLVQLTKRTAKVSTMWPAGQSWPFRVF